MIDEADLWHARLDRRAVRILWTASPVRCHLRIRYTHIFQIIARLWTEYFTDSMPRNQRIVNPDEREECLRAKARLN